MPYWTRPAAAGIILAALTAAAAFVLPADRAQDLLAVLLAAIGGAYVGIALMVRDYSLVTVEVIIALPFVLIALAGLWFSPHLLALGYFLHGLWDLVHHPRYIRSPGPWWYKPLCLVYDWIVAVVILVRF